MGIIHAQLGLADSDNSFVSVVGQSIVYTATQELLARYNDELQGGMRLFVAGTTTEHKTRFKLPANGRMARRGGQAPSPVHKAKGQWDVAFPIDDFGDAIAWDDVTFAYMTMQEYDRHISGIFIRDANTTRHEMLRRLFDNTVTIWEDPLKGNLEVQPLANGDAVLYPPVIGSMVDAADDHYLVSGYLSSAISDANNPFPAIRAELEEHFGKNQHGSAIVVLINPAQEAKVELLAGYKEVHDSALAYGDQVTLPINLPEAPGTARVIGRIDGAWVVSWDYIPADYMAAVHTEVDRPLLMRHDPLETGLGPGLQLVARDETYPIQTAYWRHRFGFGANNRLNGVVMQFKASGNYDVPAVFQN